MMSELGQQSYRNWMWKWEPPRHSHQLKPDRSKEHTHSPAPHPIRKLLGHYPPDQTLDSSNSAVLVIVIARIQIWNKHSKDDCLLKKQGQHILKCERTMTKGPLQNTLSESDRRKQPKRSSLPSTSQAVLLLLPQPLELEASSGEGFLSNDWQFYFDWL